MCGITGVLNLNNEPVLLNTLKAMTERLAHRGPDGVGFFAEENIALGHRRLAILDISENGSQPMTSHDGNWVVVFNGCIYNFQSLRLQLKLKGHSFVSVTDTEVICESLSAYGPECVKKFDGMFAIAAWHKPSKSLYLGRDRYGIKPLYYHISG